MSDVRGVVRGASVGGGHAGCLHGIEMEVEMERAREGEGKEKKVTTVSGGRGVESGLSQLLLREYGVSTGERGVGGEGSA